MQSNQMLLLVIDGESKGENSSSTSQVHRWRINEQEVAGLSIIALVLCMMLFVVRSC